MYVRAPLQVGHNSALVYNLEPCLLRINLRECLGRRGFEVKRDQSSYVTCNVLDTRLSKPPKLRQMRYSETESINFKSTFVGLKTG